MAGTTWSFSGGGGAGGWWGGSGPRGGATGPAELRSYGPPEHLAHLPDSHSYSDITEEDLEEAGVQDPAHKRLLLDTLQLSK